jgi:hypothetical protein
MALAVRIDDAAGLNVDFDAEEDVLYVSLGTPVPSQVNEAPDGLLLRRAYVTDLPSGVTAVDFLRNWRDRRSAFYALIAEYLQLPLAVVQREIERAI